MFSRCGVAMGSSSSTCCCAAGPRKIFEGGQGRRRIRPALHDVQLGTSPAAVPVLAVVVPVACNEAVAGSGSWPQSPRNVSVAGASESASYLQVADVKESSVGVVAAVSCAVDPVGAVDSVSKAVAPNAAVGARSSGQSSTAGAAVCEPAVDSAVSALVPVLSVERAPEAGVASAPVVGAEAVADADVVIVAASAASKAQGLQFSPPTALPPAALQPVTLRPLPNRPFRLAPPPPPTPLCSVGSASSEVVVIETLTHAVPPGKVTSKAVTENQEAESIGPQVPLEDDCELLLGGQTESCPAGHGRSSRHRVRIMHDGFDSASESDAASSSAAPGGGGGADCATSGEASAAWRRTADDGDANCRWAASVSTVGPAATSSTNTACSSPVLVASMGTTTRLAPTPLVSCAKVPSSTGEACGSTSSPMSPAHETASAPLAANNAFADGGVGHASAPRGPLAAKAPCRNCGSTGVDFLGKHCLCPIGQQALAAASAGATTPAPSNTTLRGDAVGNAVTANSDRELAAGAGVPESATTTRQAAIDAAQAAVAVAAMDAAEAVAAVAGKPLVTVLSPQFGGVAHREVQPNSANSKKVQPNSANSKKGISADNAPALPSRWMTSSSLTETDIDSQVSSNLDRFFKDAKLWEQVEKEVASEKFASADTPKSGVACFRVQVPKPYPGVQYRQSKRLDDRIHCLARHGLTVSGTVEDDGAWLRVNDSVFLPMQVGNIRILEPLASDDKDGKDSPENDTQRWWRRWNCGPAGSILDKPFVGGDTEVVVPPIERSRSIEVPGPSSSAADTPPQKPHEAAPVGGLSGGGIAYGGGGGAGSSGGTGESSWPLTNQQIQDSPNVQEIDNSSEVEARSPLRTSCMRSNPIEQLTRANRVFSETINPFAD
eukprot:TRINITY_DN4997_c0_g1_i1.p1 TRINITY_DN4997_c0_g1~~TRINITY_DN4997_c0_g1_i1.p1  ORF type:complete len:892 (-),score=143.09 TRINITY_DN4997_c0_g1_i1:129-2804(-)